MSTWNIDQAHSTVGFKVKHLMISSARGEFTNFEGNIVSGDDTFEDAKISFTAKADSITTNNEMRDGHLKSADFFDVEKYPTVSFTSKSMKKSADGYDVTGDLTMKDVTKEISFKATSEGIGNGMDKGRVVGFDLSGSINRQDFGLTWNSPLETGGVAVSDEVKFDIHIEAKEA